MKSFHISDILTITTGRLVSSRHMDGVYELLNFLTGDNLYTHQLPRAMKEVEWWMKAQFPHLFEACPFVKKELARMDEALESFKKAALPKDGDTRERPGDEEMRAFATAITADFVDRIRRAFELPEMIPVYEMGADMHLRIDPVEELQAIVGDKNVIVIAEGAQ